MEWARTDPHLRMLPGLGIAYALHYPAGAFRAASNRAHIMDRAATARREPMKIPNGPGQKNPAGCSMR